LHDVGLPKMAQQSHEPPNTAKFKPKNAQRG
jgi:hypothetical protein